MGSFVFTRNRIRFLYGICLTLAVGISVWSLLSLRSSFDTFLNLPYCEETVEARRKEEERIRSTVDSLLRASFLCAAIFSVLAVVVEVWLNRLHARRLESLGMFHAILHNAPSGIALLDEDLRYVELNAAMAELNHLPLESHRGRPFADVSVAWLGSLENGLREALKTASRFSREVAHGGADFVVTGHPYLTPANQTFGITIMVTEITANKEQERRLEQLTAELKTSNSELERFAYLASHDLKEPIRMISTYLGLFLDQYGDKLDARARSFLSYPEEGAQRLGRLVDSLLKYGRLGQTKPEVVTCELRPLVDEVVESLRPVITEARAEVSIEIGETAVLADRTQVAQLLQNLLSNALKFSKDSSPPQISIRVVRAGNRTQIRVSDNGVGIAEDQLERIFDLFCRLNSRLKFPGEGIGLATCKRIMEGHGGRIWATSTAGSGATFWAEFPS